MWHIPLNVIFRMLVMCTGISVVVNVLSITSTNIENVVNSSCK